MVTEVMMEVTHDDDLLVFWTRLRTISSFSDSVHPRSHSNT